MKDSSTRIVLCNGAELPKGMKSLSKSILQLEYRDLPRIKPNVKISLPAFVQSVYHLPDRIMDLLEIAAYVFAADRLIKRGMPDSVEYHSWARSFKYFIKVRDFDFWNTPSVDKKIGEALRFMTGDRNYEFCFLPGHSTPPTNLFDSKLFQMTPQENTNVVLFSGGLDSLTGIVQLLETTNKKLCLISHRSKPGTKRTQDQLFKALDKCYPNRLTHYKFNCSFQGGTKAVEESQRTRAFLFNSIAYAISHVLAKGTFYIFENGITSLNFSRRQDLINARASRTTHPKTLGLMREFLSEFGEFEMKTKIPFLWNTKTDLFDMLKSYGQENLITSTVSCSKTFQYIGQATHCGGCFQCIDRRFAAYASDLDDVDEGGIYDLDFVKNEMNSEVKTVVIDYVRQSRNFANWGIDHFYHNMLNELTEIEDYIPGFNEEEKIEKLWNLCHKHGQQVLQAIKKMREIHDNPFITIIKDSFLHVISEREYLKEPVQRLVYDLCSRLNKAIPLAFQKNKPKNENDFNDKVSSILAVLKEDFDREYPHVTFALAKSVPDHSHSATRLFIESKYIRGSTSPSKISDGIAADLIKYTSACHVLFVVYDPQRHISDDDKFRRDFEKSGRCTVSIIR